MRNIITTLFLFLAVVAMAQSPKDNPAEDVIRTTHFPKLKPLVMTHIPGAPVLSQPQRLDGTEQEIRTTKHGLCYPALYDWNHDGKLDLILGEFSTGNKENNLKVYLNVGTKKKPKFTGKYFYARDTHDSIMSNFQWCCIGIHPRFIDINHDGYLDILSGQYNPGWITVWYGSKDGFLPMQLIPQEGDKDFANPKKRGLDPESPLSTDYWQYTSAGFGDYNGDGLEDLFVGGTNGLRVALNVGTKSEPKFGLRKHLLFVDGTRLLTIDKDPYRYDTKTYMTPIDWDGDGVLDILATDNYSMKECNAISFFRGVRTTQGLRFEKPVPLFTAADGSKALPGCQPMITVADVNGDGVNDIVFGLSIPTINGYEATDSVGWQWTDDLGIEMPGKDAGETMCNGTPIDSFKKTVHSNPGFERFYLGKLKDDKYLTLRHRGYPFVMYGHKSKDQAKPLPVVTVAPPKEIPTERFADDENSHVSYQITSKLNDSEGEIDVIVDFADGWHGYADLGDPDKQEFIPTTVKVELPKGFFLSGTVQKPYNNGGQIYLGRQVFKQYYFALSKEARELLKGGKLPVKVTISYQVCNEQMCLPPVEHEVEKTFDVNLKDQEH